MQALGHLLPARCRTKLERRDPVGSRDRASPPHQPARTNDQQLVADPEFYSAPDLERHLNELMLAYSHYLSDHPEDVSALILYGKLLRRVGHHDQAFKAFLKANALDPRIAVVKQQVLAELAQH